MVERVELDQDVAHIVHAPDQLAVLALHLRLLLANAGDDVVEVLEACLQVVQYLLRELQAGEASKVILQTHSRRIAGGRMSGEGRVIDQLFGQIIGIGVHGFGTALGAVVVAVVVVEHLIVVVVVGSRTIRSIVLMIVFSICRVAHCGFDCPQKSYVPTFS